VLRRTDLLYLSTLRVQYQQVYKTPENPVNRLLGLSAPIRTLTDAFIALFPRAGCGENGRDLLPFFLLLKNLHSRFAQPDIADNVSLQRRDSGKCRASAPKSV